MEAFNIFIGLSDKDMSRKLDREFVFKTTADKLNSIGVLGFNISEMKGFWKGQGEDTLRFSFINTFGIQEADLKKAMFQLKGDLEQDSILVEKSQVDYDFV